MSGGSSARLEPSATSANGHRGVAPPPAQQLRTRQRPGSWILAGLVLAIVGALAVTVLMSRSGGKVSAIVVARPVPVGHVIARADLSTARIATDTIQSFAGAHMGEVVGKTAAVALVKGELLNPDMLSAGPAAAPDSAQVGVIVKPGQLPAGGVAPGDTVMVVVLPPPSVTGAATAAARVLAAAAPVIGSADLVAGTGSVVTVQVPKALAAQLAAASSGGQVALVKVTP